MFCCSFYSNAQEAISHDITDDGYALVQLDFAFPFYGKLFTHSVMYDNGVVGFYDAFANLGCNPMQLGFCAPMAWDADHIVGTEQWGKKLFSNQQLSYMIAPMWADIAPVAGITQYLTQGDANGMRYSWIDIAEFYSRDNGSDDYRLSTFHLDIDPTGLFGAVYDGINIETSHTVVGSWGQIDQSLPSIEDNPELDLVYDIQYGEQAGATLVNWDSESMGITVNPCENDPLYNSSCPGYDEAYLSQQCSYDSLYDASCPGYQEAYFSQQCSVTALYDPLCPGYEDAYFVQQCDLNDLYDSMCPGYDAAYLTQQCGLNDLYDVACPGYAVAYTAKLFAEACDANTLYDVACPGYDSALTIKMLEEAQAAQQEADAAKQSAPPPPPPPPPQNDGQPQPQQGPQPDDGQPPPPNNDGQQPPPSNDGQAPANNDGGQPPPEQQKYDPVPKQNEPAQKKEEEMNVVMSLKPEKEEKEIAPLNVEALVEDEPTSVVVAKPKKKAEPKPAEKEVIEEKIEEAPTAKEERREKPNETKEERKVAKLDAKILSLVLDIVSDTAKPLTIENSTQSTLFSFDSNTESALFGEERGVSGQSTVADGSNVSNSTATSSEMIETLSTSAATMEFQESFNDAIATGQSLGQFLSGTAPNYGSYDVAPPTSDEATSMKKVNKLVSTLNTASLQQNIDQQQESLEEGGGFSGDQRVTLILMSYVQGYNLYTATELSDQLNWYRVKDVYKRNKSYDSVRAAHFLNKTNDTRMKALVDLQYNN